MDDKEKQLCLKVLDLLYQKGLNNPQESMLALAFGQWLDRPRPEPRKEEPSGGK